ncbi:MAG: phospholipase D-like domain-containing protein, partial [Methanobacteriota archaeon]
LLVDASGAVADVYVYGDSSYAGPGWAGPAAPPTGRGEVAIRAAVEGVLRDHDDATDWDGLRDHRIGQSAFEAPGRTVTGPAIPVVSPRDGAGLVLSALHDARESIEVAVYTLTHEGIASVLAGAASRGVRVRVLLDGNPVGGLEDVSRAVASGVAWAGAEVRWLRGAGDVVKRYRYLHAKYAIVDGTRLIVSSENFGDSGFPGANEDGNRGWTVVLDDPGLASELRAVFEADFDPRRRDSVAHEPESVWTPSETGAIAPWSPPTEGRTRAARLVIGPDTTLDPDGLLGLLASARDRIWIEAFYIEETWREAPNPFLAAAVDAARRGVDVRILLDGSGWNDDPDAEGNDDLVDRLIERARDEGLRLEARLVAPYGRVDRVHNKGVVVDGGTVLVSSMNWAHASATENREIGLILRDPAVAAAFESALQADWSMAEDDGFRIDDPGVVAALYAIVGAASYVSLRKLRGTSKRLRPPGRMGTRGALRLLRRGGREVRLLPAQLVAQPHDGTGGGRRTRRRRGAPRGRRGRHQGN